MDPQIVCVLCSLSQRLGVGLPWWHWSGMHNGALTSTTAIARLSCTFNKHVGSASSRDSTQTKLAMLRLPAWEPCHCKILTMGSGDGSRCALEWGFWGSCTGVGGVDAPWGFKGVCRGVVGGTVGSWGEAVAGKGELCRGQPVAEALLLTMTQWGVLLGEACNSHAEVSTEEGLHQGGLLRTRSGQCTGLNSWMMSGSSLNKAV